MVRPEVARQKIARATTRLEQAESILCRPAEDFLADPQGRDLASFYLLVGIPSELDRGAASLRRFLAAAARAAGL